MKRLASKRALGFAVVPALAVAACVCMSGCAGSLASRPVVYTAEKTTIERQNYALNPVLVKPASPQGSPVLVVFASGIVGAVAIALTRELDNLSLPDEALGLPGVKVDDRQRPQTYPAIERVGAIPLAVIQSTNDTATVT